MILNCYVRIKCLIFLPLNKAVIGKRERSSFVSSFAVLRENSLLQETKLTSPTFFLSFFFD